MSNPEAIADTLKVPMRSCNICRDSVPSYLFKKNGYKIVKCENCGLVFRSTLPTDDELKSLYSENLFADEVRKNYYMEDEDTNTTNAAANLKITERYKRNGRILDVGCGFGTFLSVAEKNGWEVWGNEISRYAAEYAGKKVKAKIYSGDFLKEELPKEYFDVITMWDFIEHVCDPFENILRARKLLFKSGTLFISTGDIASFLAKILGKHWKLVKPEQHLYYFSPESISQLLAKAGFEVIEIMHRGRYFNLEYLIKSSKREYHGRAAKAFCNTFLGLKKVRLLPKRVYINFGDIMTITARKP